MDNSIYLIGYMGTGKSSVSKRLSYLLKRECFEVDFEIEKKAGMTISDIFKNYGETYFRDIESRILKETAGKKSIISCGGGAVLRDENIKIMKDKGIIVLLTASPQVIYHRVKSSSNRPLLSGSISIAYIEEMMKKRGKRYHMAADITVNTDNRDIRDIAEEIIKKVETLQKQI